MKAYQLQGFGFDSLKVVDQPEPAVAAGQVLIKLRAWSLNFRDLMIAKGQYNPKLKMPATPLSDGVGEIVKVGDGATRVKVGDRVAAAFFPKWNCGEITEAKTRLALGGGGPDGMLAEMVALPETSVVRVPEHLSDEEAATLPCAGVTAWHAMMEERPLKAGDCVFVQGTGGVSIFALQFARLAGARVIVTSSKGEKLARAMKMGASDGINYSETPKWDERVRELTDGTGVDNVVEVGGAGTLPLSMKAVRSGGQISLIGVLTGGGGQINPLPILMKNIRVQGIFVGSREMFEAMNRAISLSQMTPVVDRVFAFDQVVDALKYMESASHFGKIVIRR